MATKTIAEYPNIPSILALVGASLIVLVDVLLLAVSVVILPHLNYTNVMPPRGYTGSIPSLVSGFVGALAAFGLACGAIVLFASIAVRLIPRHRQTWGVLILVFSILSFFGFGGFIIGSLLGIIGAIMILQWKPPPTPQ
ncbi:MAG TPA: DUF6114 domain-containing protein [Candidatus Bathyarchaeia archaeon]|nr:DUF6114 domain-containing protein [Candidatus Bathyarchaeia archaeon]